MKKIIIYLLITSGLTAFALLCLNVIRAPQQQPALASPANMVPQDTRGLAQLIAVANKHNDATAISYHVQIQRVDLDDFLAHLENIAKNRGWYPHGQTKTDSVNKFNQRLVVPEQELGDLREIQQDPIRWIQSRQADHLTSEAQTNLANVNVRIKAPVSIVPWAIAGFFLSAIAGALSLAATIVRVLPFLEERRRQANPKEAWSPK